MSINKETVEGAVTEFGGQVQAAAGEAFGDTKTQVDGKIHELKGKAEQAYGKAKDAYEKASDKAKVWAEQAPEAAREAREKATRLAEESTAKVRQTVQEQPVAVLAGGIALGFVVGWLLSGRKN
ncbi:MAG: CsbD family protein [Polymorphobacter sp.]